MKRQIFYFAIVMLMLIPSGCQNTQKIAYYDDLYKEKPVTLYVVPVEDLARRQYEKTQTNKDYNRELDVAAQYCYQTLSEPLLRRGYYVMGPVASMALASQHDSIDYKGLRQGSLSSYKTDYGIDAILLTTIHKWVEKNGEWSVYLEYRMRSTKTNTDMMHRWVKASKILPTNLKGIAVPLKQDRKFAKTMGMDAGTAQRCILMERVNEYVLHNIPLSSTLRQSEKDMYRAASDTYSLFIWDENGQADVQPISMEQYESEAFL
ncbi:MAG: hypothetical protein K6E93_07740 [Bacteroidales bacterium]|jgi:hypothetical protein|nr:hypothetical protein [Bacteroidales bacterium]